MSIVPSILPCRPLLIPRPPPLHDPDTWWSGSRGSGLSHHKQVGTSGTATISILLLTPTMSRSRNPYIDDHAAVDHAVEDEPSDNDDDAMDTTEGQIRQQDERDFQMPAIYSGHQSRLVADARYLIPAGLLTPAEGTGMLVQSSTSERADPPLFLPESCDPTPYTHPGNLTPMSTALFSRGPTPSMHGAPQAFSTGECLFLRDSRDPTPAYTYPGNFTPNSTVSFSRSPTPSMHGVPQASSSGERLFLRDSRDPTPAYTYPGNFTPISTASFSRGPTPSMYGAPQNKTHSRPTSPDSQASHKRLRPSDSAVPLDPKGKARTDTMPDAAQFLDLQASDSESDDAGEDEEDEIGSADLDFIDDAPLAEDAALPPVVQREDAEVDRLGKVAAYFKRAAVGDYDADGDADPEIREDYSTDDEDHELIPHPGPHLLSVVSSAVRSVFPVPAPPPKGALPVGTWFFLRNKYKSRYKCLLAITVSYTQCVVRHYPPHPALDTCEVVNDVNPPLLKTHYSRRVHSTLDELQPFQCSALPELHGLINFPIRSGTWIRLKGKKCQGQLALVLLPTECLVERPPSVPVQRDPNVPYVAELEEAEDPRSTDPCEVITKMRPYLLTKKYMTVQPTAQELLPFECSIAPQLRGLVCQFSAMVPPPVAGDRVVVVNLPSHIDPRPGIPRTGDDAWILSWRDDIDIQHEAALSLGTTLLRQAACCQPRVQYHPSDAHILGWVIALDTPRVTIRSLDNKTTCDVEAWQVRRSFQTGDTVTVTAGEHKSRQGIIVSFRLGGLVDVFDTEAGVYGADVEAVPRLATFRVRVAHLDFHLERAPEVGDYTRRVAVPHPTVPIAAQAALDEKQQSLKSIGLTKRNVKSLFKGKRGRVEADFDSTARHERLGGQVLNVHRHTGGDTRGIMVTVRESMTNTQFTVPIEQLVHETTHLPLAQAIYLPNRILYAETMVLPPPPPPRAPTPPQMEEDADAAWGIDQRTLFESYHIPSETSGEWLCSTAVAKKRVNVLIQGVKGMPRTNKIKSTPALDGMEGHIGMLMLDDPITVKSIKEKKVPVYRIGPPDGLQQKKEPVPAYCLRPLRDNADSTSIITVPERVVIIGADVEGSENAVGSYGKTRPEVEHAHGEHFVAVQVEGSNTLHFYHVLRLCCSLNQAVYCATGEYPATTF
ncbi:hypothetical protein FB451DRAFT_1180532 [Mycena latifolia]|nr:hypothetical protein FB451DRAFT_1180532 [Mycena latifolia]